MIETNASLKSFRFRQGGGEPPAAGGRKAEGDFRGEERKNDTHASTTPDGNVKPGEFGGSAIRYHGGEARRTTPYIGGARLAWRSDLELSACVRK